MRDSVNPWIANAVNRALLVASPVVQVTSNNDSVPFDSDATDSALVRFHAVVMVL
jgi:hypothetical protein